MHYLIAIKVYRKICTRTRWPRPGGGRDRAVDIYGAFVTLEAAFELHRAFDAGLFEFIPQRQNTQFLLRVGGSHFCANLVDGEFCCDPCGGRVPEDGKDFGTNAALLFRFLHSGISRGLGAGWFVDGDSVFDVGMRGVKAGVRDRVFVDIRRFIGWWRVRAWWWRERSAVRFADAEESNGELSIRRHTFEERVAKFEIFGPVRDFLVEQLDAALHKWVSEESYTCD